MKNAYIIFSLIFVNIVAFLYTSKFGPEILYILGMTNINYGNPVIWVTSAFVHAGLLHISMNMIALFDIGVKLESQVGHLKVFLIYIISMLGSSLFSAIFLSNASVPLVVLGASGAIFGLFAYLFIIENKISAFLIFFIISNGILMLFPGVNIAWYAHLGGAIFGAISTKLIKVRPSFYLS